MRLNLNIRGSSLAVSGFAVLSLSSTLLFPQSAAAQLGFALSSTYEYIENPLRQGPSDDIDYLNATTASVTLDRQTKRFGTTIGYSANRQEYRYDIRNDQTLINGSGSMTFKAIPDLLSWQATNTQMNELVDASLPDIANNRQNISQFSTGPILTIPLDPVTFLNFSSELGIVTYEETDGLEQDRISHNLSIARIVSRRMTASFLSSYTESGFDALPGNDYSFLTYTVALQLTSDSFTVNADLGQYRTERLGQSTTSPTYTLSAEANVNSRLDVSAGFTVSVEDLVSDRRGPGLVDQFFEERNPNLGSTVGNSNAANLYERKNLSFGATYAIESAFTADFRYQKTDRTSIGTVGNENDESFSAGLQLPMPVQTRLTLSLAATRSKRNFSARGLQDRDEYSFRGRYRLSDQLGLTFFVADVEQTAEIDLDNYNGITAGVGIEYAR